MKTVTLLLTISFILASCSGGNTKSEENEENKETNKEAPYANDPLLGSWEIIEAEGPMRKSNLGTVYTFKEDGSFAIDNFKGVLMEKNDSSFSFSYNGTDVDNVFKYYFEGEQLILLPGSGNSGQTFYLEKQ